MFINYGMIQHIWAPPLLSFPPPPFPDYQYRITIWGIGGEIYIWCKLGPLPGERKKRNKGNRGGGYGMIQTGKLRKEEGEIIIL